MSSTFQNPRNPLAAMWASATESYLRDQNPGMPIGQIRRLPMMQGVYEHLYQLKRKNRVEKPSGAETGEALAIAQNAYLSQTFFDLALTTAAFAITDSDVYEAYISLLDSYNNSHDIDDFSTADLGGFALCLIVWVGYTGLEALTTTERRYLDYLISLLPLTEEQKQQIRQAWQNTFVGPYYVQYRDATAYPNYKAIPWMLPAGAQIVMLGDWGTALDDAHAFLYAIWKQAFLNNPAAPVVFIHLGDIYYTGLEYECEHYFYDVFVNTGAKLAADLNDHRFNPNPPIFILPGNHEYYSYGYGFFNLLDKLNKNVGVPYQQLLQQCSFFCLQTQDKQWQFLGMDTGQADGNALLTLLQSLGDKAKDWALEHMPDWGWLNWIGNLVESAYEDFVGPFQPTLRASEVSWLKDRLNSFTGKTIMLSHHQLFSREAKINHSDPQYMNTALEKYFSSYFKKNIAAWYWGHEHSFATYIDGLMGLNKGRLLGSSSYEATEADDTPYANNYPMVPLATADTNLVHNTDGLYYHAGAIFSQNGAGMNVKYYQFPAWSQLDTPPAQPQLEEMTTVDETITTTFKSLQPTWIGNKQIQSNVTTDHDMGFTAWKDELFLLYADAKNSDKLTLLQTYASAFKPTSTNVLPSWSTPQAITLNGATITTPHGPAMIAVNGVLYAFYLNSNNYIQGISCNLDLNVNTAWTSFGEFPTMVHGTTPSICFFQERIYIVYMESSASNNFGWGYYNIPTKTWQDMGPLKTNTGTQAVGSGVMGLAADAWHIYMTYEEKSGNNVRWAVGTPSSNDPGNAWLSWTDMGHINIATQDGTTTPQCTNGMTLNYAAGVFFMVYVSTNNHNIIQCTLYGTDAHNTGTWLGKYPLRVGVNTSSPTNMQSSKSPALAVASGGGFLVYRGNSSNTINQAYY